MSSENSAIALANSQQAKTYGVGHVVVRLGNSGFQMHVIVPEIEDEGIFGLDPLSQVDSRIDIVTNQLPIHGKVFDCSDFKNQPLSPRCMVRRSTMIEPNTEVIVPVLVRGPCVRKLFTGLIMYLPSLNKEHCIVLYLTLFTSVHLT